MTDMPKPNPATGRRRPPYLPIAVALVLALFVGEALINPGGIRNGILVRAIPGLSSLVGSVTNPDSLGSYLAQRNIRFAHDAPKPFDLTAMSPADADRYMLKNGDASFYIPVATLKALTTIQRGPAFLAELERLAKGKPVLYSHATFGAVVLEDDGLVVLDSQTSFWRTDLVLTMHSRDGRVTVKNRSTVPGVAVLTVEEAGRVMTRIPGDQGATAMMVKTHLRGEDVDIRKALVDLLVHRETPVPQYMKPY